MNSEKMLQEIQRSLGRLEGQVEQGFKGVYHRQDVTNGNIKEHQDRLNEIEECLISQEKFGKMRERLDKIEGVLSEKKGERKIVTALIGFCAGLVPTIFQLIKNLLQNG